MLGCPDNIKTAFIRHLHHFQRMSRYIYHIEIRSYALHIDRQLKFHESSPMPNPFTILNSRRTDAEMPTGGFSLADSANGDARRFVLIC